MYDDLEIPAFLRRELTPEIAARLKRITHQHRNPKIKNPPKRKRRKASGLGGAFGVKVVAR